MTPRPQPRIGLALSTIGRPSLHDLLASVAASTVLPEAVAVADHTPGQDLRVDDVHPFPVLVVPSTGGASRGRNDAAAALPPQCDLLGFPNDDNLYLPTTVERAVAAFSSSAPPAAVAGLLLDDDGPRFRLPPDGTVLDRRSVWRAIEPAMFVRRAEFDAVGGFRDDLGTGATSPWQSGDGTDVLLKVMARGGRVVSRPDVVVRGRGERKGLSEEKLIAKHRAYARGTGHVYRVHDYPLPVRLGVLVAPLVKATTHDPSLRLSLRLALARSAGRLEGMVGRPLPGARAASWL